MRIKYIVNLIRRKKEMINKSFYIVFFMYSCLMIWEVFLGPYRSYSGVKRYNLTPFKTISNYFMNSESYSSHLLFINLAANIVTFIPLGLFLTIFFKRVKNITNATAIFIVIITALETLQFILNVGVFDIDDILLNTLGCIIGYGLYKMMKKVWIELKINLTNES